MADTDRGEAGMRMAMRPTMRRFVPIVIAFGYFAYFLTAGWLRVQNYAFGAVDTALWETAMWQAGTFKNPAAIHNWTGAATFPFLSHHFIPIGFLYGLFYRAFPTLYTTIVIYAVSFTVASLFVYWTVHRLTQSNMLALGLMVLYLAIFTPGPDHFYIEDWATPYVAAALCFTSYKRYGWATVMWLAAMMFKEYISLVVTMFGLSLLVQHQWKARSGVQRAINLHGSIPTLKGSEYWGGVWLGGGILWFLVAFFGIMKHFEPVWSDIGMFTQFGSSRSDIALALLSNPGIVLARLVSPLGARYILGLFLPMAFLPLLGFEYTIAIVPIVLLNFLPNDGHAVKGGVVGHYSTMILPILVAGAALGVVRLKGLLAFWPRYARYGRVAMAFVLATVMVFYGLQGLKYHAYKLREAFVYNYTLRLHTQDVADVLAQLPPDASIAAEDHLLPSVSHRQQAVLRLALVERFRPDYVLCDSFYGSALESVLQQGLALRWKLGGYQPKDFYDSQQWAKEATHFCQYSGYIEVDHRGSLVLLRKQS